MRALSGLTTIICALALGGCSSMLPSGKTDPESRWQNYEDVVKQFASIEVEKTSDATLEEMGLHPKVTPNVTLLSYGDIMSRYAPTGLHDGDKVDSGIRECLVARQVCSAYRIDITRENRQRIGNFALDFLGFKRVAEITGWRFTGTLVLVNGTVVFKESGGTPSVHRKESDVNPLGPLQMLGDPVRW